MENVFDEKSNLYWYYRSKRDSKIAKILLRAMVTKNCLNMEDKKILFFLSQPRQDYRDLFQKIYNSCEESKGEVILTKKRRINFRLLALLFKNNKTLRSLKQVNIPKENDNKITYSTIRLDFKTRFYIYCNTLINYDILLTVKLENYYNVKNLVVLCDTWPLEYMLIKHANTLGINTTTAQHALFFPNINNESMDVLNFWKVPSNNILVWGEKSRELFSKYCMDKKIFICGNPKINTTNANKEETNEFGIIFDQPRYGEYNLNMLKIAAAIAEEQGMKVKVRIHPTDNEKNYDLNSDVILFDKNIDNCRYILGHTSTMIFEYLLRNKKVYKYISPIVTNQVDDVLRFQCVKELKEKIKLTEQYDFKAEGEKQIELVGEESKNAYKKVFNQLAEG